MTDITEIIKFFIEHPDELGRRVGFKDLTPMHGEWIREMIDGEGDYTLQAHRGSFKSGASAAWVGNR